MNDLKEREKKITQTGIIGILANIGLATGKAIVGLIAGAVSVILDAINNLSDAISSVITIIGIKLSKKKPTEKHPYGFGRIEYFSTIIIAAIILATGVTSCYEAIEKIIHPSDIEFSWVTAVVVGSAIVVKIVLGLFTRGRGKKYNSESLVASGTDALMDSLISIATLISIGVSLIWKVNIDGWIGAFISLFIIKAGIEMLLEAVSNVMGARPDAAITKAIKRDVNSINGVRGAYDLVLHNYGPDQAIGSIHVEIDSSMSAEEIHILTMQIQTLIIEKYHVVLTVGIYAIDVNETDKYEQIQGIVKSFEGALGCHGFFIDNEKKFISFDVLVDFTVTDKGKFKANIENKTKEIFEGYNVNVNLDLNYSD
ncbi:MAG: cation transporter [Acholeplasmatales bacterium]|jgi:cation diffusion facilitator family transporter|nr:cation transporter [Acholeplasmatales bacterium]MBQ4357232.1 cation transporter [Acholeplasmatales bacterium]